MIKTIYEHGGGVYDGRGIYNGRDIYDQSKDMVWLNGKYIKDTYYERQDGNVGSTFKDLVSLPEGYTKLDYVACNRFGSASILIVTTFRLPDTFSIRTCFNVIKVDTSYPTVFSTRYNNEDSGITRLINGSSTSIFYTTISSKANTSIRIDGTLKSFEASQDGTNRLYRESLLSKVRTAFTNQYVADFDNTLVLLSRKSKTNMFMLIVVDKNNRVLFTAIPCVHEGIYGMYDLVANEFYSNEFLTGA